MVVEPVSMPPVLPGPSSPVTSADELVATLPGIVWEADGTTYQMLYVSPRALDILGHDPARWTREPDFWEQHMHPEDRPAAMEAVALAIAELSTTAVAYRFRAADGTYRDFRDVLRVIDHLDGHRHIVGFMVDVSDEAAAERQRRLLAAAVEVARESVALFRRDGVVEYVNPAVERSTGRTAIELIGSRSLRIPGDDASADRRSAQALADGVPWASDIVVTDRNGRVHTEEASVAPVRDHMDRVTHWVRVSRDVTAERAERQAQARLATIVESAADACYANELDGMIVAWNEAAARIYGWTAEEALGSTMYDLVDVARHPFVREWLERVGRGETMGPIDSEQLGRDGRRLTLSVTAAPVYDDAGRVVAVATIARDVAAERRLAAERLGLEARLAQAQKLEAIGRMAGSIAHDFNNMLTAILGYATLVADGLEGDALESQRQVLHAAERASDLTRRLLVFSRPTSVDARPIDADRVLGEAVQMVKRLVPERIALSFEAGADAFVLVDPVELEQLLLNLVINAVDAIADTGEICAATSRVSDPGAGHAACVRLRVVDTGCGMDAVVRDRIFDPFFSTKGFGDGTGLGLATVQSIVTRAGGTIELDTRPGRGTTFDIFLPIVEPPTRLDEVAPVELRRGTGRLLVVDDSEVVGALAARILANAGYAVRLETHQSRVLAAGAAGIDLVVTDIVMPGMSGPQMIDQLDKALPVVFVSGYAGDHLPAELRLGTGRSFVPKPFSAAQLLAAVALALETRVVR
jgi:PAS domain S-box-containing protein